MLRDDASQGAVGRELPAWRSAVAPAGPVLEGSTVRLEPLAADQHAADLFRAFSGHDALWDFMAWGPFVSSGAFHRWAREREGGQDPQFLVLRDTLTGHCGGVASFMRVTPDQGVIEIGGITIAPEMQRGRAATEALWLMMRHCFEAGFRRIEWKCDSRNLASRRAAQRLGFSFEGIFRQHMVVKGRNRDTAWFSVIDSEWPALAEAFSAWMQPSNFDAEGRQRERLSDLTRLVRPGQDPGLGG